MNVLLYVVDALRADHLSCYGYERATTPTLDALAADGVRFENCFSPATWTRPVAATLSTGLYPPAHGTRTRHDTLGESIPTLAEQFRDAGYETVGVTSMGNVSTATGFDRGFDRFFDLYKDDDIVEKRETSTATDEELMTEEGTIALPRAEDVTDAMADWFDGRDSDKSFFAFCWSIEPHMPYDPPAGYDRFLDPRYEGPVDGSRESLKRVETESDLDRLRALYDAEIRYNDDWLDALMSALRESGVFENTLICVVGDHGDAFEEHGRLTHGHAPYDELVRVPWIMRLPEERNHRDGSPHVDDSVQNRGETEQRIKRGNDDGAVVSELTSLVDVYPTLIEAAGLEVPDRPAAITGRSQASIFDGVSVAGHDAVYFETQSYDMQNAFYGVRTPDWKYIRIERPEMDASTVLGLARYILKREILIDILRHPRHYWRRYRYDDRERLYDLKRDPGEQRNLATERADRANEFERALDTWLSACSEFLETEDSGQANIDDQTRQQLRELGYAE